MIDATAYSIKKGRALDAGTAYDILFAYDVTITLTSSGSTQLGYNNFYFLVDGDTTKKYTKGSYTVAAGTKVTFYVKGAETDTELTIIVDGVTMVNAKGQSARTYALTVEKNITVDCVRTVGNYVTVTITTN